MAERTSQLKEEQCSKLEKSLMGIVEGARILYRSIEDAEETINDCEALGVETPPNMEEGAVHDSDAIAVQAYKDWLALTKDQFQIMREEFHHLLTKMPEDAKAKIKEKLNIVELTKLFGEESEPEDVDTEDGTPPQSIN